MRWVSGQSLERRCPLCGAVSDKPVRLHVESPFPGRGMLRLLDCRACASQFFDDQSLPPDYYEDSSAAVKFYIEQGAGIDHMIWPLLRVPAERVTSLAEIGCGFGFALDFAREVLGWRVKGIDRATHALAGARLLGLDIVPAYFEGPHTLGDKPFDLVLASEVLEHVPDPNGFVRGIIEVLAPSGIAIFTTPNAEAIHEGQPVGHLLRTLSPGFHLVLFTSRSLRFVLEQAGFTHVSIEEEADSLRAYASCVPVDLRSLGSWSDRLYRQYLSRRGGDLQLDADLRLGLKYRLFKTLVNAAEWDEAEAVYAELRAIVLDGYAFDLEQPHTIPAIEPLPLDRVLDLVEARSYINHFISLVPANIVSLLYFRGSLALHTGRPREALEFFRAAGKIGVVARSLQHTLANDGETEDLFKRSFLLSVLALADFAPDVALSELARVLDDDPPPGVPSPLWTFSSEEQEWLLGTTFVRLVDRGFADAAACAFGWVRERCLATYRVELVPEPSAFGWDGTGDGSGWVGQRAAALRARPHPASWARILCARGLLDLNAGQSVRAFSEFRLSAGVIDADVDSATHALFERSVLLSVLALADFAPDVALIELARVRDDDPPPGVPSRLWVFSSEGQEWLLGTVFVRLVGRGFTEAAARAFDLLREQCLAAYGVELLLPESSPCDWDNRGDGVVDETECVPVQPAQPHPAGWVRMLCAQGVRDLNAGLVLRGFTGFRLAADLLERDIALGLGPFEGDGEPAALYMHVRVHEVLALRAVDPEQALRRVRPLLRGTCPPEVNPVLWNAGYIDRVELLCDVFVGLVNRGDYSLAASLVPDVEVALGAGDGAGMDPRRSLIRPDHALDAIFCRGILALNHEMAYGPAAEWFRRAFEEARKLVEMGTALPSVIDLLWTAKYHEALSCARAGDTEGVLSIAARMVAEPRDGSPPVPAPLITATQRLVASEPEPSWVGPDDMPSLGTESGPSSSDPTGAPVTGSAR